MNTPQSLPNTINLVLTNVHFANSKGYFSNSGCALAVAINEYIKDNPEVCNVSVGGSYVEFILKSGEELNFDIVEELESGSRISKAHNIFCEKGNVEPLPITLRLSGRTFTV
jgi:hypothetical protein